MISKILCIFFFAAASLFAQVHDSGNYPLSLRGEVWIELEPVDGSFVDEEYPLDMRTAAMRALEESAFIFSAMIYGWSFNYDVGERARQISENFELTPVSSIPFGDPGLSVTEVEIRDFKVRMWADYHLTEAQQRRLSVWRTGITRNAQAVGYWLPGGEEGQLGWLAVRKAAIEDAARAAVRGILHGSERNRPKEARGFISLASFPNYFIDSGRWAASARFRVQITEIVPFSAY
jgi:hypothetical protein